MKQNRKAAGYLERQISDMLNECVRALEFPLELPLSRDTIMQIVDDPSLFAMCDQLCSRVAFNTSNRFRIDVHDDTRKFRIEVLTDKSFYVPFKSSFATNLNPELNAQLVNYCDVRAQTERDRSAVNTLVKEVLAKCSTWGQVIRVLPVMKHFMRSDLVPEQLRMSRMPAELKYGFDRPRIQLATNMLTRAKLLDSAKIDNTMKAVSVTVLI